MVRNLRRAAKGDVHRDGLGGRDGKGGGQRAQAPGLLLRAEQHGQAHRLQVVFPPVIPDELSCLDDRDAAAAVVEGLAGDKPAQKLGERPDKADAVAEVDLLPDLFFVQSGVDPDFVDLRVFLLPALDVRRHAADNAGDVAGFGMHHHRRAHHQPAVDAARLADPQKTALLDVGDDQTDLVDVRVEQQVRTALLRGHHLADQTFVDGAVAGA